MKDDDRYDRMTESERIEYWRCRRAVHQSNNMGCAVIVIAICTAVVGVAWALLSHPLPH